jgi:hypothetical protein
MQSSPPWDIRQPPHFVGRLGAMSHIPMFHLSIPLFSRIIIIISKQTPTLISLYICILLRQVRVILYSPMSTSASIALLRIQPKVGS